MTLFLLSIFFICFFVRSPSNSANFDINRDNKSIPFCTFFHSLHQHLFFLVVPFIVCLSFALIFVPRKYKVALIIELDQNKILVIRWVCFSLASSLCRSTSTFSLVGALWSEWYRLFVVSMKTSLFLSFLIFNFSTQFCWKKKLMKCAQSAQARVPELKAKNPNNWNV